MTDIIITSEHLSGADEGSIVTWLFKNGTPVKEGEVVCEVMVEKTQLDVLAPASGALWIKISEEEVFTTGSVIGKIE
jgi:2-oxoglutarate dehydrogenase E2 component (dihydrolipoamide succinyltransferase)